jgi:hypothetical protein
VRVRRPPRPGTHEHLPAPPPTRRHSNLCVDVVIPVDQLPPPDAAARHALLQRLTAAPPGQEAWECGGVTNFTIAAARLGLRTGAVGHLGRDVYGDFMERVLLQVGWGVRGARAAAAATPLHAAEGCYQPARGAPGGRACRRAGAPHASLSLQSPQTPPTAPTPPALPAQDEAMAGVLRIAPSVAPGSPLDRTLVCFVLVDPAGRHAFCSRCRGRGRGCGAQLLGRRAKACSPPAGRVAPTAAPRAAGAAQGPGARRASGLWSWGGVVRWHHTPPPT